jgi:penicillin amidase
VRLVALLLALLVALPAGAGEPALPGVSLGHNEDVAWTLTIFAIDQQDLVVNPKGTKLTEVTETIAVKGEAPRAVVLKFTADGPVIYDDAASGRSFAEVEQERLA